MYSISNLKSIDRIENCKLTFMFEGANLYFKLFVNPGAPLRIDKKVLNILDDCNPLWSVCVSLSPALRSEASKLRHVAWLPALLLSSGTAARCLLTQ